MQLRMSESEVVRNCLAAKIDISAIEALPGGGVRLVCNSAAGADQFRLKLKTKLFKVETARASYRPTRPLW
jgi:hypothetical protein